MHERRLACAALALLACALIGGAHALTLSNALVRYSLDDESFAIVNVTLAASEDAGEYSYCVPAPRQAQALWQAVFVMGTANETVSNTNAGVAGQVDNKASNATTLVLVWADVPLFRGAANASISITLALAQPQNSTQLTIEFAVALSAAAMARGCALWQMQLVPLAALGAPGGDLDADQIYLPYAFGRSHNQPSVNPLAVYDEMSPGGNMAMQFAVWVHGPFGLYVAAHDPQAQIKSLQFTPAVDAGWAPRSSIGFTLYPTGMGVPQALVRSAFPIVLQPFASPNATLLATWWLGSQIYRSYMLAAAAWVLDKAPLAQRTDVPAWLINNALWLNTDWQPLDIFNGTAGDPNVVLQRMAYLREHCFPSNVTMALHWYMWSADYRFDQGYPDYFPAKEDFQAVMQTLQDVYGVYVMPYTNGRLFDTTIPLYEEEHALDAAAKQPAVAATQGEAPLEPYPEEYGSGVPFVVMCPYTTLWQTLEAGVVGNLSAAYNVTGGVYIDQVAAAPAVLCLDPTHDHGIGGGDYWRTGYSQILASARAQLGPERFVMVEANSEHVLGDALYLTITAYLQPVPAEGVIVPMFPAVYGGYYLSAGQFWTQTLYQTNHGVPFFQQLGLQLVFGTQLGWFSLGDTASYMPFFADPAYASFVAAIELYAQYHVAAVPFIVLGRLMSPLGLALDSPLAHAVWQERGLAGACVAILATNPSPDTTVDLAAPLAPTIYDFAPPTRLTLEQVVVQPDGSRDAHPLALLAADEVFALAVPVPPRGVVFLTLCPLDAA